MASLRCSVHGETFMGDDGQCHHSATGVPGNCRFPRVTYNAIVGGLTSEEHEALRLSAELSQLVHKIIGDGPAAEQDWTEFTIRIHGVQHMILKQCAARAFPNLYRALGQVIPTKPAPFDPDAYVQGDDPIDYVRQHTNPDGGYRSLCVLDHVHDRVNCVPSSPGED